MHRSDTDAKYRRAISTNVVSHRIATLPDCFNNCNLKSDASVSNH